MPSKLTLAEALKQAMQDDNRVSKYEARVIADLVTSAGHLSTKEREQLKYALDHDNFDEEAYRLLHELLLKEDLHAKKNHH
jgi:hypothetical protein